MAALTWWSNVAAIAMLNAGTALLNAGGAGSMRVYDGTMPADADAALSGNPLLAQLTCNATSFPTATDGTGKATAVANAVTQDSSADATGTGTFVRYYNNAGTCVRQLNLGTSSAAVIIANTTITATQVVQCSAATENLPEAGA